MEKSGNSRNDELEKKISQMLAELDNKIRRDILNHISKKGSASFTELMQVTDLETSKLAFHLKKLGLLLKQDQDKRYSLSDDGKVALEMLDYGRERFGKKQAVLLDKIEVMIGFREYASVMKQVIISPAEAFKNIDDSKHKFLLLALLCVVIPRGLMTIFGEGFKSWGAIVEWIIFAIIAHLFFLILQKKGSFTGLLSALGIASFPIIFMSMAVGLMANLPFYKTLELETRVAQSELLKQNMLSPYVIIPMTLFALGIVYYVYLTYKALKESREVHPTMAVIIFVVSVIIRSRIVRFLFSINIGGVTRFFI